eukprot:scaffold1495_cov248-Pinguiococcus_pyrenoidosus.AAC.1
MARRDGESIRTRDAEDAQKLAVGIQKAVDRGVLPAMPTPPAYQVVDVLGKSADQVAAEICAQLPQDGSGFVVTLVGLSGTGKGTTVSKLKASLPGASTWSNGNIFRSLTLLAVTHCEQQGVALTPEVLTAENLQTWMGMLSFGEFNGRYDIRIRGLGLDLLVSEVQNTTLKQRKVGKNIPTVAQETQGEVVKFAADALKQLSDAGKIVLLEGREQTVNYIPTEYRFELIMSDPELIGKVCAWTAQPSAARSPLAHQDAFPLSPASGGSADCGRSGKNDWRGNCAESGCDRRHRAQVPPAQVPPAQVPPAWFGLLWFATPDEMPGTSDAFVCRRPPFTSLPCGRAVQKGIALLWSGARKTISSPRSPPLSFRPPPSLSLPLEPQPPQEGNASVEEDDHRDADNPLSLPSCQLLKGARRHQRRATPMEFRLSQADSLKAKASHGRGPPGVTMEA